MCGPRRRIQLKQRHSVPVGRGRDDGKAGRGVGGWPPAAAETGRTMEQ